MNCILSCYREESEWTLAVEAIDIWGEEPRENRTVNKMSSFKWILNRMRMIAKRESLKNWENIQNRRTLRNVYLDEFSLHPMKENYKERFRTHFQN
jgi:hypothetical protein